MTVMIEPMFERWGDRVRGAEQERASSERDSSTPSTGHPSTGQSSTGQSSTEQSSTEHPSTDRGSAGTSSPQLSTTATTEVSTTELSSKRSADRVRGCIDRGGIDRGAVVAQLRRQLEPWGAPLSTLSSLTVPSPEAVLPVPNPLQQLLPGGGLPRGGIVSLRPGEGSGADKGAHTSGATGLTTLLFTLLAGTPKPWTALVGFKDLGMTAAAELGVDLARTVVIPDPGADLGQILSILVDGVDVLVVRAARGTAASSGFGPPARQRVLASRLRQRGAVLVVVGDYRGADLVLSAATERWDGVEAGHGRLRSRELLVQLTGRRLGGQVRQLRLQFTPTGDRQHLEPRIAPEQLPIPAIASLPASQAG
jgi:hypothetical protein